MFKVVNSHTEVATSSDLTESAAQSLCSQLNDNEEGDHFYITMM